MSSSPPTISSMHQQACGALRPKCPPPFPGRRFGADTSCAAMVVRWCISAWIFSKPHAKPLPAAPLGRGANGRSWAAGTWSTKNGEAVIFTVEELAALPLFAALGETELEYLAGAVEDIHLIPGEYVAHEGEGRALRIRTVIKWVL